MDLDTVQNIVNTKGYAFLTQGQKDIYNNQFGKTKPAPSTILPTSSVGVVSSEQGMNILNGAKATETKLSPQIQPPKTETPKTETKPVSTKVNLINPNTGQEVTFEDASINKDNIKNYLSMGYQVAEAAGNVPTWLTANGVNDQNTELDTAKAEIQTYTDKLKNFDVSQDPQLQGILSNISSRFDSRIREMERINASRNAAISTTGVRLGSRYTGGAGGVFGGIIAEEERQGIDRIADLEAQKQQALTEAKSAYESKQWNKYVELVNLAQKKYDQTLKEVSELNKMQAEQDKKFKEATIQSSRDLAVAGMLAQGITDPIQMLATLNLSEEGKQVGDFTAEELNKTIKNLMPSTKDAVDLGVDGKMFEYAKQNGWLPEGSNIFDYWKMEAAAKKSPSAEKVGMGAGGISDYKQFSKEQIALSVIPTQLKNSDAEMARLIDGVRLGLAEGKTPYEVADNLMGYMVENPSSFSEGMRRYISIADLTQTQVSEMARLINAQQYDKAIFNIEEALYKKAQAQQGDTFLSEADVKYAITKANEIQKTLDSYGFFDVVGPFSGTFNEALGRLGRRKGAELKAKITNLTSEIQKRQAGSALTENEWKRILEPIIPQLTDKVGTFETKINELKNNPLMRLNATRSSFEMPSIGEKELFDRKLRVPAYSSSTALDPLDMGSTGTPSENNPLNLDL